MNEQEEKVTPEAQEPQEPQTEKAPEEASQAQAQSTEEKTEPQVEKTAGKKKKEKGYTLTAEQMEKMEQAAAQLESVKDQYTRLAAEYDNYRKRTAREKENLYEDAKMETIKSFLAVYDNLERAVAACAGEDPDAPHRKGLEMIFHQYQEILKKLGVTEMEALGAPFDPEKHNAVIHIDDENYGENVISQVFQAGFVLGDKVIRHAIVQVAN